MTKTSLTDAQITKLLGSKDHKQRFVGEYHEVKKRAETLDAMLDKYDDRTLGLTLDSPYALLVAQSNAMWAYIEQIDL